MTTTATAVNDLGSWEATIIAKSLKDPAFKKAFLADPKAVAAREFNISIPEDLKIQGIEAPANTLVVVIPYAPAVAADGEMSDDDLESVAGGSKSGANAFFNTVGNGIVNGVNQVTANTPQVGSFIAGAAGVGSYNSAGGGSCKTGR